ncbi:hypothetical protein CDAR_171481 [Caerostris darwini]|uniref:Uncharacterized protein n=1 Tax=Caerostris darwini TaxID=1538125 RepID=A0AAV4WM16_9ARAC|nr:hypothetical protein CDAR_171481 [Caerostris darwini]
MTKQASVVRTTWSDNSLDSPDCAPVQLLKDRKKSEILPRPDDKAGLGGAHNLVSQFISFSPLRSRPTFKRSKEEVRVPLAFLIESFHGVVKIQRRISRFISAFVSVLSHCLGNDLQKDFKVFCAPFNGVLLQGGLNCWTYWS